MGIDPVRAIWSAESSSEIVLAYQPIQFLNPDPDYSSRISELRHRMGDSKGTNVPLSYEPTDGIRADPQKDTRLLLTEDLLFAVVH